MSDRLPGHSAGLFDPTTCHLPHAAALIGLLRDHILKEDRILFPMAQRILGEAEQHEVDGRAAAIGAVKVLAV